MRRAQTLVVVVCAVVVVLGGSWKAGVVAVGEVQGTASSIDPLVLNALRWRGGGDQVGRGSRGLHDTTGHGLH